MSFETQQPAENTALIRIGEMLDLRNADEFRDICENLVDQEVHRFMLHFDGTRFVDSTGIGAIFSLYREVDPLGGEIAIIEAGEPVKVVLERTQAVDLFPQYGSVEEARNAFLPAQSSSTT